MPDADELGTAGLRARTQAARAAAGSHNAFPAPPPDLAASPFAQPMAPAPSRVASVIAAPPEFVVAPAAKPGKPAKSAAAAPPPPDTAQTQLAFKLVNRLMSNWAADMKTNLGKANLKLSHDLGRNGALLIRDRYPIDTLSSLIRLCVELGARGSEESELDPRLEAIHQAMMRPGMVDDDQALNAEAGLEDDGAGEEE